MKKLNVCIYPNKKHKSPHLTLVFVFFLSIGCSEKKKPDSESSITNDSTTLIHSASMELIDINQLSELCQGKTISINNINLINKNWVIYPFSISFSEEKCSIIDLGSRNKWLINYARWKLTGDTLLFIFSGDQCYGDISDQDTAIYKIGNLTTQRLTIQLLKNTHSSCYWNFLGDYADGSLTRAFDVEILSKSVLNACIIGKWYVADNHNDYSQPYIFNFMADGTCHSSGKENSDAGSKGKWSLQENLIYITWSEEYNPKTISDDGYGIVLEYDTIRAVKYDSLHILKYTNFGFVTKEKGLVVRRG